MKHIVNLLVVTLFSFHFVSAQKVDNIRTEQSGDFIKIRYNILNSKPGEVYKVVVLCSINGGLKTELESISGDAGNQVPGGKPEYWVVWDVLKDVDELKSAEFIVRAELLKSTTTQDLAVNRNNETTDIWSKKRFNVLIALVGPGPKYGFRVGYMGKWGITTEFLSGKTEKSDADYQAPNSAFYGAAVTKRIINQKNTQLHLLLGVSRTTLVFLDPNSSSKPFVDEIVAGPELGFMMSVSKVSFSFAFSRFDPGQIEKGTDLIAVSPATYLDLGLGFRF
jgi:hypothetical protein